MTAASSAETAVASAPQRGLGFSRFFTGGLPAGVSPYDAMSWEIRTASISNEKGEVLFEQEVEVPGGWSQTATNVVANKYLHGKLGTPERESSVRRLVHRVVDTIAGWGTTDGYFPTREDAEAFRDDLAHLILAQKASFNSPVWFNVGIGEARGYGWCYDAASNDVRNLDRAESRPQWLGKGHSWDFSW